MVDHRSDRSRTFEWDCWRHTTKKYVPTFGTWAGAPQVYRNRFPNIGWKRKTADISFPTDGEKAGFPINIIEAEPGNLTGT
jgi:hypothetical protein